MTFHKLASSIAFKEGKKSQARIGDIREILKIIVDMDVAYAKEHDGNFGEGALGYLCDRVRAKLPKKTKKSKPR